MSISRPFAYNPTLQTDGVELQYGTLSVGNQDQSYGDSPGGLKWWNGPDEETGYVFGTSLPTGGIPGPDGVIGDVTFWGTENFSENNFITLVNTVTSQNFTTVNESIYWLNTNGYWTSILSKLFIFGSFTLISSTPNYRIIRLNTDGLNDSSFVVGAGFNNPVYTSAIQSDGKIIIGGQFTTYQGTTRNSIARLNTDGSYDSSFVIGTGFNSFIFTSSLQSDEKIVVGGNFTTYKGVTRNYIARLTTNGDYDTSFVIGTGFNNQVITSSIQSDGKIIVGGQFTSYSGISSNYIARLNTDGSYDSSFVIGTGFNNNVNTSSVQSDGKIIVGGFFTSYSGISSNRIARLNTNGSYDTSFVIGTGFNDKVTTSSIQSDGKIILGGQFTTYSGISSARIIRLNTDGSYDNSFVIGTGFSSEVRDTSIQLDGKIIVCGDFTSYSGISSNRIARLNTNGAYDSSFVVGTGFDNSTYTALIQSDGKIIASGTFGVYKPSNYTRIAPIFSDGSINSSFVIGTSFNGLIRDTSIQLDGKIIVCGEFTSYSGISSNRIARLNTDGSYDTTFVIGSGFSGAVYTASVQSDGKIIVGGEFTSYSGISRNYIIRLNTDGSNDSSFVIGTGFSFLVYSTSIQSDGKIIAVGTFATYSGISSSRIARLNTDGSYDSSFVVGAGFDATTYTASIQSDGKIIIGGSFTSYSGISRNYIIRLNTDGSNDSSFVIGNGFNGPVETTSLQSDGKIIIGGGFSTYSGISRNRIARLNTNGSNDASFNIGTGFGGTVLTTSIQLDGKIIAGGQFNSYNGISKNFVARLNTDGSNDSSFNIYVNTFVQSIIIPL